MSDNKLFAQSLIDLPLPMIVGNQDYLDMLFDLEFFEKVIFEGKFVAQLYAYYVQKSEKTNGKPLDINQKNRLFTKAIKAIRISLLHKYDNTSLSEFCKNIASKPVYQKFLGINQLIGEKIPSKSFVNEVENSIPIELIEKMITDSMKGFMEKNQSSKLGFLEKIDMTNLFFDSTCFKANIHYPVDYIFMRDVVRTIKYKLEAIRDDAGIKVRMPYEPEYFLSKINSCCMAMSAANRTHNAVVKRKGIFREMRDLLNALIGHSQSHYKAFHDFCQRSGDSSAKSLRILTELKAMIEIAPEVISLAKRRILDQEVIPREEKFFSIYEHEINIIKRHKDGADYEFGNTGYLIEQEDGFILTCDLLKEYSPGDAKLLIKGLNKTLKNYGLETVKSICGDRGCSSKDVDKEITKINKKQKLDILNAVASKDVHKLMEQLKNIEIADNLKRRSGTEARIAILKRITNNPMRQKGIENRRVHFLLSVLMHNIIKGARTVRAQIEKSETNRLSA